MNSFDDGKKKMNKKNNTIIDVDEPQRPTFSPASDINQMASPSDGMNS